jgi:hypothetical protein
MEFIPAGSGEIGTVMVKLFPAQPAALVGVTLYTAFNDPPVRLVNVSVIKPVPLPAPPVNPGAYEAVHTKVLPVGIFIISF